MDLTYSTKRDLVQRLRQWTDWYFSVCTCDGNGEIPTIEDSKLEQHDKDCPYRQRIEKQQTKEGE